MKKSKTISFAEFRHFLQGLGYKEKATDSGQIFHHPKEGLLLFRRYRDDEHVDVRDLMRTRKFFDLRGLLEEADFDTFMQRANTPA
jgi:hypothetical protein